MKNRAGSLLFVICCLPVVCELLLLLVALVRSLDSPRLEFPLLLLGLGIRLGEILSLIVSGIVVFVGKEETVGSWRRWFVLFLLNATFLAMAFSQANSYDWADPAKEATLALPH